MVFFNIFENPDIADVQIVIKHAKIDENSKKIENLIPKLSFGGGFIKFHKLARFLQHFSK